MRSLYFFILVTTTMLFSSFLEDKPKLTSDVYKDFPVSEQVKFNLFKNFNFKPEIAAAFVDNNQLWLIGESDSDFGRCFDLITGKELGVIAYKGDDKNKLVGLYKVNFDKDSVNIYTSWREIKSFSKKDIIENKPIYQRGVSCITSPEGLRVSVMHKLPNGSVLTTLVSRGQSFKCALGGVNPRVSGIPDIPRPKVKGIDASFNEKSIAVFDNESVKGYNTIDYSRFCYSTIPEYNVLHENKLHEISSLYSDSKIVVNNNRVAFALSYSPIIYLYDLKEEKIISEKIYSNIVLQHSDKNDGKLRIMTDRIVSNGKYILCLVTTSYKDNFEKRPDTIAILVYDWDLNPVKKFDLGNKCYANSYVISEDCCSAYVLEYTEKGVILSKASLNF